MPNTLKTSVVISIFISVKKLLLILISIACIFFCPAQTTTGTITGKVTGEGEPLELASVTLLKTSFAASAGKNGEFELKNIPAGKYQLHISFVGYENFQTEVVVGSGISNLVNVFMIPLTARLKEIVVTGTMKEVKKSESVTPVDVYTAKYFNRNPVNNVFDAVYQLNGIFADVDNGVSNTTDVQINGLEGNYSMFLIDGVPAMNGLAGTYALTALPMSMIDKIEIVKGSSSTLYGSEAIAGVINIKTKDAGAAPRFAANVSLTSMLEANADVSAAFKLKKVSSLFSVSAASNNYRWDIDGDNFMDIPLVNRFNFYNKWSFNRKDNRVANTYARYLYEDRLGGDKNVPFDVLGTNQYYTEWITTHQWQAGLQYQLTVKEKLMLLIDYSEHRQNAFYGLNRYNGIQRTGLAQLTLNKKLDNINDLLLGVSYRLNHYTDNTGLAADSIIGYKNPAHIAGLFMEDEMSFGAYHKLLMGARFDYSTRGGPVVTPRINYKWNSKNEKNVLRLGAGTGYRIPNLLNEGFGAMNGSRQIVVTEELKPETTFNAYANYTRVQNMTGGVLNIDANVFYTRFFNYINPEYTDEGTIEYSNNKLGATSTGFNLNADFTFNYPLKVGIGLTYAYTFEVEVNDDGEKEKKIPPHAPPLTANFYLSYNFPVPQISFDLTGNVVSPMLLSTVPDDYRPEKSPWFSLVNIQMTKKFSNGIEIYFGLKNIFNFIQKEPILRPFDPFNRNVLVDNPNNYRFDTTYGFTSTQGIKGFVGLRYTLQ